MAEITHLPNEIIGIILENKNISIEDIIRFKSTCKKLHQIVLSNCFWRKKFYQRCSTTTKKYYTQKPKKTLHHLDLGKQMETGLKNTRRLQYYVSLMSNNNLSKINKNQLENLLLSIVKKPMIYYFVLDEINRIISAQLSWPFENLTIKYNLELIFSCLKLFRIVFKLTKFLNESYEKQLIEKLFTIVAQYFQPHICYSVIKTWLDDIAQEVLSLLKISYPAHRIFSTSFEEFLSWKTNNISDNYWNPTESIQIMRILEEYIFSKLEIDKLLQLLIISDIKDEHKQCISDLFPSYLLTITYNSVARRLGVRCIVMSIYERNSRKSPEKPIKIVWKPKYTTEAWDNAEYFYMKMDDNLTYPLNIFRGKYYNNTSPYLINNGRNLQFTRKLWYLLTDIQIIDDMLYYFIKKLSRNDSENYKWKFYELDLYLLSYCVRKDTQEILNEKDIRQNCYEQITKIIQVKSDVAIEKQVREGKGIKYTVGMVVTHRPSDLHNFDNHDGVIVGWHYKYRKRYLQLIRDTSQFPYLCPGGYDSMCSSLADSDRRDQPHYIILNENNKICYVEQDRISICPPREIDNIEIGRFFYRFDGTHYTPNKNLEENYPDDNIEMFKILVGYYSD